MGNKQNANFNPYKNYDAAEEQRRRQALLEESKRFEEQPQNIIDRSRIKVHQSPEDWTMVTDDICSDPYRNTQSQPNASKSSQKSFKNPIEEEKKSYENPEIKSLENSENIGGKNPANLAVTIPKIRPRTNQRYLNI